MLESIFASLEKLSTNSQHISQNGAFILCIFADALRAKRAEAKLFKVIETVYLKHDALRAKRAEAKQSNC